MEFVILGLLVILGFGLRGRLKALDTRHLQLEQSHKLLWRELEDLRAAHFRHGRREGGGDAHLGGDGAAGVPPVASEPPFLTAPAMPSAGVPSPTLAAAGASDATAAAAAAPTTVPAIAAPRGPSAAGGAGAAGPPVPPDDLTSAPQPPATAPTSIEEQLGTRWAVWVGGIALALGGVLLVRHSIEMGLFGPGLRIAAGVLFALALIVAGERFRRSETTLGLDVIPSAHIPGILTAAGTMSAFGTTFAAYALYDFIGPTVAFLLLGALGVATMMAAALHGPALAGLGLVGALATPLLVTSTAPNPWTLVVYLAVVAAAGYALARLRQWLWLAASVAVGVALWGVVLGGVLHTDALTWTYAAKVHAIVHLLLAGFFVAMEPNGGVADENATTDWIGTATLALMTALVVLVLASGRFDYGSWIVFTIAAVAILGAMGVITAPVAGAALLAGIVAVAAMVLWPGIRAPIPSHLLAPEVAEVLRLPVWVGSYLTLGATILLGLAGLVTWRLARGPRLALSAAACLAGAATVPALIGLVVAYLRVTQFDRSIPFACFGAALGALYAIAAEYFQRREGESPTEGQRLVTGAFAAAALAGLAFALVASLERGYLTVAFALAALGTAFIATRKRIPLLRHAVTVLGAIVLARLAWDPLIMGSGVGRLPLLNWLLLGYGVPAIAFALAGRILRTEADDVASRIADALAVVFAGLLVFFQVRHLLNGGDILASRSTHVEQGLLACMGVAFSYVLMRLDLGRHNPVFRVASNVFAALSALGALTGLGAVHNPYITSERILGPLVASSLVLGYLLPGIAALVLARRSRGVRPDAFVTTAGVLGIMLIFGYVTLEVRHAFQGEYMGFLRRASAAEKWSYTVAWLAFGVALLGYGIWRGSREARLASAALVLLAVLKAFLWDLAGLANPWRALSFIVLGLVLIGIGLVYQRIIFARPAGSRPTPAPALPPA